MNKHQKDQAKGIKLQGGGMVKINLTSYQPTRLHLPTHSQRRCLEMTPSHAILDLS